MYYYIMVLFSYSILVVGPIECGITVIFTQWLDHSLMHPMTDKFIDIQANTYTKVDINNIHTARTY